MSVFPIQQFHKSKGEHFRSEMHEGDIDALNSIFCPSNCVRMHNLRLVLITPVQH